MIISATPRTPFVLSDIKPPKAIAGDKHANRRNKLTDKHFGLSPSLKSDI
eukprot:TRINITY_DN16741_c0_g1_i1.p1 TRINITY_DN16741_c0_g1~~TRINITY_DN16741_c0_g1_i1.p1  ORF type:complete len:50 (+),score=0.09 TRINITY_DN16741_c0_g1_i1:62-211(+)